MCKSTLTFLICILIVFGITGCQEANSETLIKNDAEATELVQPNIDLEKKQLLEVFDSSSVQSLGIITDNKKLYEIIENEMIPQWEYLNELPSGSQKLCTFKSYEVVTEPIFLKDEKPWITIFKMDLYRADNNYFVVGQSLDEGSDIDITIARIPDSAGAYLQQLTKEKFDASLDKSEVIKKWNAGTPQEKISDTQLEKTENADEKDRQIENHEFEYPYHDIGAFDYDGVVKASEKQKIEVVSANDNSVVLTITDLNDIVDFLNHEQMPKWRIVDKLPSDAQPLRYFVRYALPRKTTDTELIEQSRLCLYKNADSYYIETIMDYPNSFYDKEICLIPDDAGEYLATL